jgi:hypothetical protein
MNLTRCVIILSSLIACATEVHAEGSESCSDGKIQQCFVDGSNSNCVCLDPPSSNDPNPEAAPDGYENPEGGGQEL